MTVRDYEKKDIEALTKLWKSAFGDPESFISTFFEMLPDMGSCIVGEEDGQIVAMASVIAGQELQYGGSIKKPVVGYIYAVAVDEAHRGKGYGEQISKAAYDLALRREATIVCTLPAGETLYDFYADTLGFETALYRKKYEVKSDNSEMTMKLTATEYLMMKEGLLAGKSFLRLSPYAMRFFEVLCSSFGGGLYASMSGICAAEKKDDTCIIYEMISQKPDETAKSIAWTLGCEKAEYYLPCSEKDGGEKFIMADKGKIMSDAVWNIAYE